MTVRLNPRYARWHLDNPEVYESPSGRVDSEYETETLIHLACCLGEPVYGVVDGVNVCGEEKYYHVYWKLGNLKMDYWVERKDFTKVQK